MYSSEELLVVAIADMMQWWEDLKGYIQQRGIA